MFFLMYCVFGFLHVAWIPSTSFLSQLKFLGNSLSGNFKLSWGVNGYIFYILMIR